MKGRCPSGHQIQDVLRKVREKLWDQKKQYRNKAQQKKRQRKLVEANEVQEIGEEDEGEVEEVEVEEEEEEEEEDEEVVAVDEFAKTRGRKNTATLDEVMKESWYPEGWLVFLRFGAVAKSPMEQFSSFASSGPAEESIGEKIMKDQVMLSRDQVKDLKRSSDEIYLNSTPSSKKRKSAANEDRFIAISEEIQKSIKALCETEMFSEKLKKLDQYIALAQAEGKSERVELLKAKRDKLIDEDIDSL